MIKQFSNILECLEELEHFLNDFSDSMAYKNQIDESRKTLKLAVEELEELIK